MHATWLYILVLDSERSKGYGSEIYKRTQSYLNDLGVTTVTAVGVYNPNYVQALGFEPTGDEKIWTKTITPMTYIIPEELTEISIRVVKDDVYPEKYSHLISWYRKTDGAAIAKIRIRIE